MTGLGVLFWLFVFAIAPLLYKYHLRKLEEHYRKKLAREGAQRQQPGHRLDHSHGRETARELLILSAQRCLSVAASGGVAPEIDDKSRKNLAEVYGDDWLSTNEALLRAMLAFVDDFRTFASPDGAKLHKYFEGDPVEVCLLNIFSCVQVAGMFETPTLRFGEPNPGAFTLAFGLGDLNDFRDNYRPVEPGQQDLLRHLSRAGTALILQFAVSFALESERQRAA